MMTSGKMTTLARPYAVAAFEYAVEKQDMSAWEVFLQSAAKVAQDVSVQRLLSSPSVTREQLATFFCEILVSLLNTERKNFIQLLVEHDRLMVLPDIALLFGQYRAIQEKTSQAHVISAIPLDDAYQQKLIKVLTARLQRQVELQCEVDPLLLGGVIVRVDDKVIDGSIRGKLTRLLESL
jgi:F-type H+-transporting ATPase subunit delta